jgi:hypothetical protein
LRCGWTADVVSTQNLDMWLDAPLDFKGGGRMQRTSSGAGKPGLCSEEGDMDAC